MLAHCAYDVSAGAEVTLRPPEEYVLNVAQIALTAEAQGIGVKGSTFKDKIKPTVVKVTSKDIHGEDVTSTLCTLDHNCRQISVALTFGWDEDVVFSLAQGGGEGPVSITGYLQPSPEDMDGDGGEEGGMYPGQFGEDEDDDSDDEGESDEEDSDDDEEEEDKDGVPPVLEGGSNEKRKRSFDLDSDAIEARSHGGVDDDAAPPAKKDKTKGALKKSKKEEVAATAAAAVEDDDKSNDSSDPSADGDDDDEDEELDEQALKAAAASSDDDDDDKDDDSSSEEEEDLTPEGQYVMAIMEALAAKGGTAPMSSLGNVPRPEGLPKVKVSAFLKAHPHLFKQEAGQCSLF
mmetsp:Transcript_19656/g.38967  ORF Transcript_19656/g.38967 Transcript_19656/m.38967 type:complete len:347 (+) Transcript_19656:100-1140(+)